MIYQRGEERQWGLAHFNPSPLIPRTAVGFLMSRYEVGKVEFALEVGLWGGRPGFPSESRAIRKKGFR